MNFCKRGLNGSPCGNGGPKILVNGIWRMESGRCGTCYVTTHFPESVPPLRTEPRIPGISTPVRYAKCSKCGADMDKRVACVPCGQGKKMKVCPNCEP